MIPSDKTDFVGPPKRSVIGSKSLNGSSGFAGQLERLPVLSLALAGLGCLWLAPRAWTVGVSNGPRIYASS